MMAISDTNRKEIEQIEVELLCSDYILSVVWEDVVSNVQNINTEWWKIQALGDVITHASQIMQEAAFDVRSLLHGNEINPEVTSVACQGNVE